MKYLFAAFLAFGTLAYLIDYKGIGQDFGSVANAQNASPIVVELYTSQSCSSCPPADKVLAEIAAQPNVIALGCHVTYWNHLHWKDTLSLSECTDRQRAFNAKTGRVYTPQMVVNGDFEFVGSRRGQAISALENAVQLHSIRIFKQGDDVQATFPNLNANRDLVVEWIGFNNRYFQSIPSGENRGRDITYSNPVQFIQYSKLKQDETSIYKNAQSFAKSDNLAILIRDKKAGQVIAAGQIKL